MASDAARGNDEPAARGGMFEVGSRRAPRPAKSQAEADPVKLTPEVRSTRRAGAGLRSTHLVLSSGWYSIISELMLATFASICSK